MLKTCPTCRGQKKIQGLGWMEEDCPACDGSGKSSSVCENETLTEALESRDSFDGAILAPTKDENIASQPLTPRKKPGPKPGFKKT